MKKIVFIKLGGSLITEKDKPFTVRLDVIERLSLQIKEIYSIRSDIQLVLGTGAGSFGHYPVVTHNLKDGIVNSEQSIGFGDVNNRVTELNSLVVESLIKNNIAVNAINASSIFTAADGRLKTSSLESFFGMLDLNIVPIIYGNIIYDSKKGCTIFSTEKIFEILINVLLQNKYVVDKVIHLSIVDGVLDEKKEIIRHITQENFEEVKKHLYQTEGYDVTGGMLHKIEKSLEYTDKGIQTFILSGNNSSWKNIIIENTSFGTQIM